MEVKPEADYLFEIAWEVCNKVGGIYTVLTSKTQLMVDLYKNYFLIGPYVKEHAENEFEKKPIPDEFKKAFESLKKKGLVCHYGTWQVKGEPNVILIEFQGLIHDKENLKTWYWENFKIDSLYAAWDFEEPMIWATAVGMLLRNFKETIDHKKIVAHSHEWMSGFALLYLKQNKVDVKTVFTTHATMLGRALAGSGRDIYSELKDLDPDREAVNSGVQAKYSTEKACAANVDVFTTVSEITAIEVEKILGKKPDILLLNGLDVDEFPTYEEAAIMHRENKKKIREFTKYFFFPYYTFDIEETYYFFIVGRYEYKNKGLDIFIKALAKLNEKLKNKGCEKTFVAFFFIPRDVQKIKIALAENKITYGQITSLIDEHKGEIEEDLLNNILTSKKIELSEEEFNKEFMGDIQKLKRKFMKPEEPMLVTHDLNNEENDEIIKGFIKNGLLNRKEDKVKVIFYPLYLTGVDGLLDLSYYDTITGCHLGVFPSYYEPWGYTPLETAALGVASLTTDFGGFGRFILSKGVTDGVFVLKRFNRPEPEMMKEFVDILFNYSMFDRKQRVEQKLAAKKVSQLADWKILIENYVRAHNLALKK